MIRLTLTLHRGKMRMTIKKRILVVSDLQVPYHHEKAISNLIKLTRKEKFDQVLNVGDELDMQSQSKWAKGTPVMLMGMRNTESIKAQN